MTQDQIDMLWRFAWVCDELRAGNSFSDEALHRWAMQARNAAHGTKPRSAKTFSGVSQAPLLGKTHTQRLIEGTS